MSPALVETLAAVVRVMADARAPWWIIAGAAVALHGVETSATDVDVLIDMEDAVRMPVPLAAGRPDARFRSAAFGCWAAPPLPVEFMAGSEVHDGERWVRVHPLTRIEVVPGTAAVFVPSRDELVGMLRLSGRPKDLTRAALLHRPTS